MLRRARVPFSKWLGVVKVKYLCEKANKKLWRRDGVKNADSGVGVLFLARLPLIVQPSRRLVQLEHQWRN